MANYPPRCSKCLTPAGFKLTLLKDAHEPKSGTKSQFFCRVHLAKHIAGNEYFHDEFVALEKVG